jgi:hypothetical protein
MHAERAGWHLALAGIIIGMCYRHAWRARSIRKVNENSASS